MPQRPLSTDDLRKALLPFRPFDSRREVQLRRLIQMLEADGTFTPTALRVASLAGVGTRHVVADANGNLSAP